MFTTLIATAIVAAGPTVPGGPTVTATVPVPTEFWQICPEPFAVGAPFRKTGDRAVVLIHGLMVHPLNADAARHPYPHDWQHPEGDLVRGLAGGFDVYGYSYAQTRAIDEPGFLRGLGRGVLVLKAAGYREIVLVGHSAGGVIARRFVEQYPKAGVTKVLSVAAPHHGSGLARIPFGVPLAQRPFIRSLAPAAREDACRGCPKLNPQVEFCCIVCKLSWAAGDTVVAADSQWPVDLCAQGIPAVVVPVSHMDAVKDEQAVRAIVSLAQNRIIRWTPDQVARGRRVLFGD